MNKSMLFGAGLAIVILGGCPEPVVPHPVVEPVDTNLCAKACLKMEELKCEEGQPIDMGTKCSSNAQCKIDEYCGAGTCHVSCEVFCKETQATGVWLNPTCVMSITACNQIESVCYVGKPRF